MNSKFQNVILYLSDGRKIVASIPPLIGVGEAPELKVVKVEITEPAELPKDMYWGDIGTPDNGLDGLMDGEEMMPWTRS